MHKLVLMRHGESQWNLDNRFTGWTDVPLTDTGVMFCTPENVDYFFHEKPA